MPKLLICPTCAGRLPAKYFFAKKNHRYPCPKCDATLCFKSTDRGLVTVAVFVINFASVIVSLLLALAVAVALGVTLLVALLPAMLIAFALAHITMVPTVLLTNEFVPVEPDCLRCGKAMPGNAGEPCASCGWLESCPKCEYDLRGNPHATACPECGCEVGLRQQAN